MADESRASGVAYAVVHFDPPEVYLAEDVAVLHRVLAMELVARTDPSELSRAGVETLRQALLDERWGDAVQTWMSLRDVGIDVYTYLHVYSEADVPSDLVGAQLQFTRLFRSD